MSAHSLTGVWDGLFSHPHHPPVTFLATLIEAGSSLGGAITEPCASPGCPRATHHAILAGTRSGSVVSFVKSYDPPGFGYEIVAYQGTLNSDGTEIEGRWTLKRAALSGKFLMVRAVSLERSATTEAHAKPGAPTKESVP